MRRPTRQRRLPKRHLVIFARYPVAGGGKRRLAASVGQIQAVRFQRVRLHALAIGLSYDPRWTTWLAVTPDRSGPWPAHVGVLNQGRGDLGQRLARVMTALPQGPALIIGTDIPGIRASHIAAGFQALGNHDAVFGPAPDGGYWLVGLKRTPCVRLPFAGVRWSSPHALADTIQALGPARVALIDTLEDIDDGAALKRCRSWDRMISSPRLWLS
jgi:uncharacterized protein